MQKGTTAQDKIAKPAGTYKAMLQKVSVRLHNSIKYSIDHKEVCTKPKCHTDQMSQTDQKQLIQYSFKNYSMQSI